MVSGTNLVVLLLMCGLTCANGRDCKHNEFHCNLFEDNCIVIEAVCNGYIDCYGSEDESNCQNYTCLPGFWKCQDNLHCLSEDQVCDGYVSCDDGSDENICDSWICPKGFKKCNNKLVCMELERFCDGHIDCKDGSDEFDCLNWNCTDGYWKCNDGLRCILEQDICSADSTKVCLDGSHLDPDFCITYDCGSKRLKCADGIQCIFEHTICDRTHRFNCMDTSDELCTDSCIPEGFSGKSIMKRCEEDESRCLPVSWYCDGKAQCPDGSDEQSCSCEDWDLIQCAENTICISTDSQ